MDKNQKEMFIKKFITEVKNNYTGYIVLGYEFDEQVQQYNIWHNRKDLQLDKEFKTIVGKLMKEILFDNRIFDFYFGYDSEKAAQVESQYEVYEVENETIGKFNLCNIIGNLVCENDKLFNKWNNFNYNIELNIDFMIDKVTTSLFESENENIYNDGIITFYEQIGNRRVA